jgi:MoaA/NifB/PqqE/SkfB family radical SAM enzyme
MCSYRNEIRHTKPQGSDFKPLMRDEIINLLHEFPKGSNVTFTGGEVLVKKGAVDILAAAAKLHKVSLATNGILLTEEIGEKLVGWGIQLIGLSLDGPRDIHNEIRGNDQAYDKLIAAVGIINEQKKRLGVQYPRLSLNGVILRQNFARLYENLELASRLNINSCTFQIFDPSWSRSGWRLHDSIDTADKVLERVEPIDRNELKSGLELLAATARRLNLELRFVPPLTPEEVVDYYDNQFNLSDWHCFTPWSTMRISPYGDVFPCLNFNIGNVRRQKPAALWNGPKYRKFRRMLGRSTLFEACVGCCKMIRRKAH